MIVVQCAGGGTIIMCQFERNDYNHTFSKQHLGNYDIMITMPMNDASATHGTSTKWHTSVMYDSFAIHDIAIVHESSAEYDTSVV